MPKAGSTIASWAARAICDPKATKDEKAVAASALTQKGSTEKTSAKVASSAAKILLSKTASKEAKSAAASALTQRSRDRTGYVDQRPRRRERMR